jgi:hypothetical protein
VTYVRLIGPRLGRWGATDDEVARPMPGDDLFPDAPTATRAITIDAQLHDIWPWLVQLGYGRAGWSSYDWIDNDGRRSAEQVLPELQRLEPGDEILMIPGLGFSVRDVEANHFILSTSGDTGTWCMELVPIDGARTRLISRWRDSWRASHASQDFLDRRYRSGLLVHGAEDAARHKAAGRSTCIHSRRAHHLSATARRRNTNYPARSMGQTWPPFHVLALDLLDFTAVGFCWISGRVEFSAETKLALSRLTRRLTDWHHLILDASLNGLAALSIRTIGPKTRHLLV